MNHLFVTGLFRSGTTLMEKLLSNHSRIKVASQPFPLLFIKVKEAFLNKRKISRRYPLGHLFGEDDYRIGDFTTFLSSLDLGIEDVRGMYKDMEGYVGNWTPELGPYADQISGGELIKIYASYLTLFEKLTQKESDFLGSKEIVCEEYMAYFLERGVKVVHMFRDPRDVLVSLSMGSRNNMTGLKRPSLYTVRAWRKSVAFHLLHRDDPNYLMVRLEDLISESSATLEKVFSFLGVTNEPINMSDIRDQFGKIWLSNSSFDQTKSLNTGVMGRYRNELPVDSISFIEKLAYPELRLMGYETSTWDDLKDFDLSSFREPFKVRHHSFPDTYSTMPSNIEREKSRLRWLTGEEHDCPSSAVDALFLDQRVFEELKSQMA